MVHVVLGMVCMVFSPRTSYVFLYLSLWINFAESGPFSVLWGKKYADGKKKYASATGGAGD